jgi:hypothetical protein
MMHAENVYFFGSKTLRSLEPIGASRMARSVLTGFVFSRHWISPTSRGAWGLSLPALMRYPVPKAVRIAPSGNSTVDVAWLLGHQYVFPFRLPDQTCRR